MANQRQQEQIEQLKILDRAINLARNKMLACENERTWARKTLRLAEGMVPHTAKNNGLYSKPRAEILNQKAMAYFEAYFQYQCLNFERNLFGLYLGVFTRDELQEKQQNFSQVIEEEIIALNELQKEFQHKYCLELNLDFNKYRQKLAFYQASIDLALLLQSEEIQEKIRTLEMKAKACSGYFNFFRTMPQQSLLGSEESRLEDLLANHFGLSLEKPCPAENSLLVANSWNAFFNFLSNFFGSILGRKTKAEEIEQYLQQDLKPALTNYLQEPEKSSQALTQVIHQGLEKFLFEPKTRLDLNPH